jgi:hypothetical protein
VKKQVLVTSFRENLYFLFFLRGAASLLGWAFGDSATPSPTVQHQSATQAQPGSIRKNDRTQGAI